MYLSMYLSVYLSIYLAIYLSSSVILRVYHVTFSLYRSSVTRIKGFIIYIYIG